MKKLSAWQKYLKPVHKSAEILECGDQSPRSRKHHLLWWQTSRFNLHRLQVSESKSI
jgi:hypothetical protein